MKTLIGQVLTILLGASFFMIARAQSLRAATICSGAATLTNGTIVTLGQPFVGVMMAPDGSLSANVGILSAAELRAPSGPPRLYPAAQLVNGRFQMIFSTQPRTSYVVQASTNLLDWESISTAVATGPSVLFEDALANNFLRRFYRVMAQ